MYHHIFHQIQRLKACFVRFCCALCLLFLIIFDLILEGGGRGGGASTPFQVNKQIVLQIEWKMNAN